MIVSQILALPTLTKLTHLIFLMSPRSWNKVSNGPAEGLNSQIKMIKVRSRGFRNKVRFANAIYFHLGGLDLYPEGVR